MVRIAFALLLGMWAAAAAARSSAPLYDPVSLNIGLGCQWQQRCIADQKRAMKKSLKYVKKYQPPTWRIQLCNRNAARRGFRVDWVGFDNCIRNASLRPPPPRIVKKRPGRISRTMPRRPAQTTYASKGERGN